MSIALPKALLEKKAAPSDPKKERIKNDPVFKKLFKLFDKGMAPVFEREAKKFNQSITKVENKIVRTEKKMLEYCAMIERTAQADMIIAEKLVNQELRFKTIMAQWTNSFLARSDLTYLDPLTWSFARSSLNICLAYEQLPAKMLIQADVHKSLCGLIKFKSELVVGPALMALTHISLHDEMKPAITLANCLPTIIKLLVTSESKPILCQASKLLASLALHFPNKSLITNSGNLHGLLDLILGTNKEIDESVAYAALTGITNVVYGSDANRRLIIDLSGIKPLLSFIQHSTDDKGIEEAIKSMGNVVYCNTYTAGESLSQGYDRILVEVLNGSDIMSKPSIVYMCLASLSNLCFGESTQSHIGSSEGVVDIAKRIILYAEDTIVVAEAAVLLLAIMWQSKSNKILVAGKDIIPGLCKRIMIHSEHDVEDHLNVVERCCHALATCLLYKANHERFYRISGLEAMVKIMKQTKIKRVVAAVSMMIVCCVPGPEQMLQWHHQEYSIPVEKVDALPVLKKAKFEGFGHLPQPPDWLTRALILLSLTDEGLAAQGEWVKEEFVDKLVYCKEFCTEILPDVKTRDNYNFRGLMFSVY